LVSLVRLHQCIHGYARHSFSLIGPTDLRNLAIAIGALGFTITAAANLREKEDHWNAALGGAVGGAIAGLSGM